MSVMHYRKLLAACSVGQLRKIIGCKHAERTAVEAAEILLL